MRNSDLGRPPRPRKETTGKSSSAGKKPFSTDRASYPNQRRDDDRKPFGEKKPFGNDRPFQKRDDDRPDAVQKPFGEKKPFSNDRPFQKRDDRRDAVQKPFGEKKPFGDKPKSFSEDRPSHPFKKRDESGRATSNDRKNAYSADKPRFQKNEPFKGKFEPKENQATSSRIDAPEYNEEKMKSKLPEKVQKKLLKEEKTASTNDLIRLNRYISNAGIASRRDADELIASGQITVNGKEITEMGYKVKPDDVVKYGKKILNREKMVYLLLNKPKDFITTTEDPDERRTVMDLVKNACPERIYPVGRLDRNTTGLLLLTNDGELAEKLSHPSHEIKKIYQAELDRPITTEDFETITNGIEL